MSTSITDEEYESARSLFLEMVRKEYSTNVPLMQGSKGSKGSGRTSGTSVVTSSRYNDIKNYLEMLKKAEEITDEVTKVKALQDAKNHGLTHWKQRFRLKETEDEVVLETIGDVALVNHGVRNRRELKDKLLSDEDYVKVLCIDTEECFDNLYRLHEQNHKEDLYKVCKPIYDCNYSVKVCHFIKKSCPVCTNMKVPKKNHKRTSLYFSVISIGTEDTNGLANILIVMFTRKQYFFLVPLLYFSWEDVAASIFDIISVNGLPEEFRYIKDDSVLLSAEEKSQLKAGTCEEVEALVVNHINVLNHNNSECRTWGKSRLIGTTQNFKEGVTITKHYATRILGGWKDYTSNYMVLLRNLPKIQYMMNDGLTYSSHNRSEWINGKNSPLKSILDVDPRRTANSLALLSDVSCREAKARVSNEPMSMKTLECNMSLTKYHNMLTGKRCCIYIYIHKYGCRSVYIHYGVCRSVYIHKNECKSKGIYIHKYGCRSVYIHKYGCRSVYIHIGRCK